MEISDEIKSKLCLRPNQWLMTGAEKTALIGLLHLLRPQAILEFGTRFGGSTEYFSEYGKDVVTVDVDPECKKYLERFPNVRFLNMTTQEATALLKREGKHFDFALVDADHSTEGVYRDTTDAMSLADVIIFHDSYRPECRRGIKKAVAGRDVYCDLDFVPGCLQSNGLWGGLGLIFPALSHNERYNYDPRVSAYPYLALQSLLRNPLSISQVSKIYDLLKRIDRRLERTVAILREKW